MARTSYLDRQSAKRRFPAHQGQIIRHFTPNWFATTMGTGVLSIALAQFPSQPLLCRGGEILWVLNIVLFTACCVLYLSRWLAFPKEAARIFSHSVASMFFGCIPMGLATIINGFLIYGSVHFGTAASSTIAYELWWIDVGLSLICGLAIPFMMFTRQEHTMETMTAVWLLPIVACEVASVTGGLLLPHIAGAMAKLSVMTTSYVLWACSVP
jgi:tellurite resistance protein TehA-like permease